VPRCCHGPADLCGNTDPELTCNLWVRRRPLTNCHVVRWHCARHRLISRLMTGSFVGSPRLIGRLTQAHFGLTVGSFVSNILKLPTGFRFFGALSWCGVQSLGQSEDRSPSQTADTIASIRRGVIFTSPRIASEPIAQYQLLPK